MSQKSPGGSLKKDMKKESSQNNNTTTSNGTLTQSKGSAPRKNGNNNKKPDVASVSDDNSLQAVGAAIASSSGGKSKSSDSEAVKIIKKSDKPPVSTDVGKVAVLKNPKQTEEKVTSSPSNTSTSTKPSSQVNGQISIQPRTDRSGSENLCDYNTKSNGSSKHIFSRNHGYNQGGRRNDEARYDKRGKESRFSNIGGGRKNYSGFKSGGDSFTKTSTMCGIQGPHVVSMLPRSIMEQDSRQDGKGFTDDSKLSRLLRKLSRDDDKERRIANIRQFKQFLQSTECSRSQLVKSLDSILAGLQDIFFERGFKDVKSEAAVAMGTYGSVLGMDAQRYLQWLFNKLMTVHNEEVKILLLNALLETIKSDERKQSLRDFVPSLTHNVQTVLENADSPELLVAVVNIILPLSKTYPHVFSSHFCDTVDILIGWHIDSSQKETLTTFVSKTLIAFHNFWISDMNFSITLLGHFLEDMEAYAEDLSMIASGQSPPDEEMPYPENCVSKISALLRVFTTVVDSLGSYLTPGQNSHVTPHYLTELVTRVVQCVQAARKIVASFSILTAGNLCVSSCLSHVQSDIFTVQDILVEYTVDQWLTEAQESTDHYGISLAVLTRKAVVQLNTQLPVDFIQQILGARSAYHRLKFSSNGKVVGEVLKTLHAIMSLKSVPLLEEAYSHVVGDLEIAVNSLLTDDKDTRLKVQSDNPLLQDGLSYHDDQAQTAAIFAVCVVAEIGNSKSNLIGMWALTPSLFNLFHDHLLRLPPTLYAHYPALFYAFLQALYSHCSKHGQFLSSSTLVGRKAAPEGSVLANVNPTTGGHLAAAMRMIARMLEQNWTSHDARSLLLRWTRDIITGVQNTQNVHRTEEYTALLAAVVQIGHVSSGDLSMTSCTCLSLMLRQTTQHPERLLESCRALCAAKISSSDVRERKEYMTLMQLLPLSVSTKLSNSGRVSSVDSEGQTSLSDLHCQIRHNHMVKLPTGTFHSHSFKAVMGYLLFGNRATKDPVWLESIYHVCQRAGKETDVRDGHTQLAAVIDENRAQLWFWATWEAAQFCILAKLRTPLGKPQDTFTTIETVLKRYSSEAVGGAHGGDELRHEEKVITDGHLKCQTRVNALLMFMDHLEKLLYNAYEGCAVAMASTPRAVRAFFRTNRQTCEEWLHRIRLSLVVMALYTGHPATAVRHAADMLRDMKAHSSSVDLEKVVVYMVRALVALRSPEALQGLYVWCKETFQQKFSFIKAAIDKASGRYEDAALTFTATLKTYVSQTSDDLLDDVTTASSSPANSPKPGRKMSDYHRGRNVDGDVTVAGYIVDEIVDCYCRLNSWQEVTQWQDQVQCYAHQSSGSPLQQAFQTGVDSNLMRSLSHFGENNVERCSESLMLVPGADLESDLGLGLCWAPTRVMEAVDKRLLSVKVKMARSRSTDGVSAIVEECVSVLSNLVHIHSVDGCGQIHSDLVAKLGTTQTLLNALNNNKDIVSTLSVSAAQLDAHVHDVGIGNQTLSTLRFLQSNNLTNSHHDMNPPLRGVRLDLSRLARKQHNYKLAQRLLVEELHRERANELLAKGEGNDLLVTSMVTMTNQMREHDIVWIERETAKLLLATCQQMDALDVLSNSTARCHLVATVAGHERDSLGELHARSLLSLVKWLQNDQKALSACLSINGVPDEQARLGKNLRQLLVEERKGAELKRGIQSEDEDSEVRIDSDQYVVTETDAALGRLLHLSTQLAPNLAKAWFTLACWCYKWGRKAVDNASTHGCVELLDEERELIVELLPKGTKPQETEAVMTILSQLHSGTSNEEDISDQDQSLYDDGTETTRRQLLASCLTLQIASDGCLDRLLDLWRRVVKRVYHHYQLSANAYFVYLKLNGTAGSGKLSMDGNITSTLRLLRLLVKHAWELRGVLEQGLAHTPTAPWKGIIPQLFSRLNHPESYVRQSVSDLLCRVAEDSPHLIVYPAVVGCSSSKVTYRNDNSDDGILNNYLAPTNQDGGDDVSSAVLADPDDVDDTVAANSQEYEEEDESRDILQNCFTAMVHTLSTNNPIMISEVEILVSELRRVTLLWDELWLGTLNQYAGDVQRRFNQLEQEVKKVQQNPSLSREEKDAIIKEKHVTLLKPTLYTLDRLKAITSLPAETPHELWFQETFGELIDESVNKLRNPENPGNPPANWQLFKHLHQSLQQRSQKRSNVMLQLDQISSKLSSFHHTVIAMPGLGTGQLVTIESIHNTVQILPTKTKPKKLIFVGSDGKKYSYLFKGLEDLHLDERIMQFLSIVNNMFARNHRDQHQPFRARHYSVTPLDSRSGLIQWVEGCTPLFGLYKRWQQREAMTAAMKQQSEGETTAPANPTNIPRPSEIYYKKLTPALKDKGITNLENRKDWPLSVMRRVLEELQAETPGDLLAKELWCSSTSAMDWWQVTQTFNRSTAVMSMIGYIIGLGDRHLDNVLVDLSTGEVVHIDYNVCFEKGRNLRVPEKVPFRMTQNIQSALGVSGIEGTFRLSCEHVIKTMRKGRETLLTLLEAFVYDPLVDWTTGNEGGYAGAFYGGWQTGAENFPSKRQMEREITMSMFSIRTAEMRGQWTKNRESMQECVPKLLDWLERVVVCTREFEEIQENYQLHQDVKTMITQARQDTQHTLRTLSYRFSEYSVVKSSREDVQTAIRDLSEEGAHWLRMYEHTFTSLKGPGLQQMCTDLSKAIVLGEASHTHVVGFLQGAGQTQALTQCDDIWNELSDLLVQRQAVVRQCLDILLAYSNIIGEFPSRFFLDTRDNAVKVYLQQLTADLTLDRCEVIAGDYSQYWLSRTVSQGQLDHILQTENRLQTMVSESNSKLVRVMDRRTLEDGTTGDTGYMGVLVQEHLNDLHQYITDHGESGKIALSGVLVSALCSLSKRYLIMETAAASAGDRLMDLTSRDGDWFLDELYSMSGNISQLLDILKLAPLPVPEMYTSTMESSFRVMSVTHQLYSALQDLNTNFRNVILPESIKAIHSEDLSVLAILNELNQILAASGMEVEVILTQLEMSLRNAIMGMEQANADLTQTTSTMRALYQSLLQPANLSLTSDLTPGQMLLMVFNNLFVQLDNDFSDLLNIMETVRVPETWRKIDIVREAKGLQISAFNGSTLVLLSDIFFVKKLVAMQQFFSHCSDLAGSLYDEKPAVLYDWDALSRPVRQFIAEFVRKQVIGLASQNLGYLLCLKLVTMGVNVSAEIELRDIGAESKVSLEDLCKKGVEVNVKQNNCTQHHLSRASALTSTFDGAWRKQDLAKRLSHAASLLEASYHRSQRQLARYQWYHEDALIQAGRFNQHRLNIMTELQQYIRSVAVQETTITGLQEKYLQLEQSIEQRLKWASGANPGLNSVLAEFEQAARERTQTIERESKLSTDVLAICQGLLRFEALRTRTGEAAQYDENFLQLLMRCKECCILIGQCQVTVEPAEEKLVELKPLPENETLTETWMNEALHVLEKEKKAVQLKMSKSKTCLETGKESVKSQVSAIRTVLATHHKLMSDIRTILKSMAKLEEHDEGDVVSRGGVRDYMELYKTFSETFTSMLKLGMAEEVTSDMLMEIKRMAQKLELQIPRIYEDLINLAPPLIAEVNLDVTDPKPSFAAALKRGGQEVETTPRKVKPDSQPVRTMAALASGGAVSRKLEKVSRDPKTGKAIQERNSYAVGVWRRVRLKLDGRDPDLNKKLSVPEQVEFAIKEATSVDNLCALYEGWTPWV